MAALCPCPALTLGLDPIGPRRGPNRANPVLPTQASLAPTPWRPFPPLGGSSGPGWSRVGARIEPAARALCALVGSENQGNRAVLQGKLARSSDPAVWGRGGTHAAGPHAQEWREPRGTLVAGPAAGVVRAQRVPPRVGVIFVEQGWPWSRGGRAPETKVAVDEDT